MSMKLLQGAVCAQITPLCEDGSIDLAGVRALTRRLVDGGIPCLYPNGTNGESLSLSQAEREAVAQAVVDEAGGRATVYIQCGAATVRETEVLVRHAISAGADGAGVMTPVFFALDDEAIYRYYASILDGVGDFPIYAYNIPPRAGNDLSPSVLGALMGRYDALKGVKYSYPTTAKVLDYLSCALPRRASVLVGSDAMALPCILYGGDGWVSGPSAAFTGLHARLWREICAQSFAEAAKTQNAIIECANQMRNIPEIPAIKYLLMRLGVIRSCACRPPLRPLRQAEKETLDALLSACQT